MVDLRRQDQPIIHRMDPVALPPSVPPALLSYGKLKRKAVHDFGLGKMGHARLMDRNLVITKNASEDLAQLKQRRTADG